MPQRVCWACRRESAVTVMAAVGLTLWEKVFPMLTRRVCVTLRREGTDGTVWLWGRHVACDRTHSAFVSTRRREGSCFEAVNL